MKNPESLINNPGRLLNNPGRLLNNPGRLIDLVPHGIRIEELGFFKF
jgi:hypothetical protein